jgi:hypothetical protein
MKRIHSLGIRLEFFTHRSSSRIPHPELYIHHSFEAPGGFEPPHKGFADLSLTTWVRRRIVIS